MRFLFVDRILELSQSGLCRGIKHISCEDYYLTSDEQGRACFISSFIGEVLGQLAAWNVMQQNGFSLRPVAGVVAKASMHRKAYVGETLFLEAFIDNLDDKAVEYHGVASIQDEVVFTLEGALGPLLPMPDFIDKDLVLRQFQEIHRPSDWSSLRQDALGETISYKGNSNFHWMGFDRILASEPGVSMLAEKRISRSAPYFADHFPNKPVLPMTVLLECKLNLVQEFLKRASLSDQYQVCELRKIKMNDFIQPGDIVHTQVKMKLQEQEQLVLSFRSEVDGRRVCVLDVVLLKGKR